MRNEISFILLGTKLANWLGVQGCNYHEFEYSIRAFY